MQPGEGAPLADVREAVLGLRRGKGMVLDPDDPDSVSAGSFFTNPILDAGGVRRARGARRRAPPRFPEADGRVKTSAAWLIERAGFQRGHGNPEGIAISSKHTLALTNRGAGTTAELLALAREIAGGRARALRRRARAGADAGRRRLALGGRGDRRRRRRSSSRSMSRWSRRTSPSKSRWTVRTCESSSEFSLSPNRVSM